MNTQRIHRRRKFAGMVAVLMAIAVLLSSTYAWHAISQSATNYIYGGEEGGRIHDDFDGENKDVYAENYGQAPLFVRIMLTEFMEINNVSFCPDATWEDRSSWTTHIPHLHAGGHTMDDPQYNTNVSAGNRFRDFIEWEMGGQKWFMPTHNQAPDCLRTSATGRGIDDITGGQTGPGDGTHDYWAPVLDTDPASPTYGTLVNRTHTDYLRLRALPTPIYSEEQETHTARQTANATVLTMRQWQALPAAARIGPMWVIDTDGWAYWAQPLMPGEATGLLLNSIEVVNTPPGQFRYAINVIGQFSTLGSLETAWAAPNTDQPTAAAQVLLDLIAEEIEDFYDNTPSPALLPRDDD